MRSSVASFRLALGMAAVGLTAVVLGAADDAPGGSLIGILLMIGAVALGVRTARRAR